MTHAGGRPTEYKEEYIEMVDEYLSENFDTYDDATRKLKVKLPTMEGFSTFIEVNRDTLYEWGKVHPKFSDALSEIKKEQQKRLLNMGLSGEYNSTIAKLILSSNHGMSEKTEIDQNIKGSISLTDLFDKSRNDNT